MITNYEEMSRIETEEYTITLSNYDWKRVDGTTERRYEAYMQKNGSVKFWNFTTYNLVSALKRYGKYLQKADIESAIHYQDI